MPIISPMSVVDPKAHLDTDVEVGPFCVVGPNVVIGKRTKLISHVTVIGHTTLGEDNVLFPNAVIGAAPQDLKYRGAPTRVVVGNRNNLREAVTIHCGTEKGGGITRLGDDNLLMVNVHLGHDAQFGSRCVLANNVAIAGHVICGDNVVMMGMVGIHHFVTIGDFAYLAAASRIHHDVPPYVKVSDDDSVRAVNAVGLRRAGVAESDIEAMEETVRRLFIVRDQPFSRVLAEYASRTDLKPCVNRVIDFLQRRNCGKNGRYLENFRAR